MQKPPRPTHAIIARKPCGCLMMLAADLPEMRLSNAQELGRALLAGGQPGYLPRDEAMALPWSCEHCPKDPPLLPEAMKLRFGDGPVAFVVTGEITYRVTVHVRATVSAADEEAVLDEVTEQMMPTCLLVDDGDVEVEHEDDCLEVQPAPAGWPGAGQLALDLE